MNFRQFARLWLEQHELFANGSDYDGMIGETVMQLVEKLAEQRHSGGSMHRCMDALTRIYQEYEAIDSPIWRRYWTSEEGQRHIRDTGGVSPLSGSDSGSGGQTGGTA